MDEHETVPNYGLPSRAILLLIWGLVLVQVAVNARTLIPPMAVASSGSADFSIFYTGARILRFGWRHELYNLNVQARFHSTYYRNHPLPYNHPAYELLLFLPLAGWKFSTQYYSWLAINLAVLIWMAVALSRTSDNSLLSKWVFVLSAALAFPPIAVCLLQGQDTLILTLIYSLAYQALKQRRDFMAGVVLSLGLFKFHLVVPLLLSMLIRRYWKFIQGFIVGTVALVAVSIAITGFGGFLQYAALLRLLTQRPEIGYTIPVLMPNLRGLLAILIRGRAEVEVATVLLSLISVGIAARMMVPPTIRDRRFDRAFAFNVTSIILVSYNLYLHDLSLALVSILVGANALRGTRVEVVYWWAVVTLFCMPIYALALNYMVGGFLAVSVICLAAALVLIRPISIDRLPAELAT